MDPADNDKQYQIKAVYLMRNRGKPVQLHQLKLKRILIEISRACLNCFNGVGKSVSERDSVNRDKSEIEICGGDILQK